VSVAIAGSVSAPSLAVALALRPLIITLHWRLRCERCTVPVARPAALQQETRRPAKQFAADVALVGGVVAAGGRSVPASEEGTGRLAPAAAPPFTPAPRRALWALSFHTMDNSVASVSADEAPARPP